MTKEITDLDPMDSVREMLSDVWSRCMSADEAADKLDDIISAAVEADRQQRGEPVNHPEDGLAMVKPVIPSNSGELKAAASAEPTNQYQAGYAAACRMAADLAFEAYRNHVYADGLDGLSKRCEQMRQILLTDADNAQAQPSGNSGELTDTYTPVLTPEQIDQVRRSMQPWQHMTDFARAIERAAIEAYQRQQWISVEDRLPEIVEWQPGSVAGISDPVLVYLDSEGESGSRMEVWSLRRGGRGDLTSLYWDWDSPKVKYWMPLPPAPEVQP